MKKKIDSEKYNSFQGMKRENINNNPKTSQKAEKEKIEIDFDISWKAIVKVLLTIFAIFFASKVLLVAVIFFFAFVLMSSLLPIVNFLRKKGIPKLLAITVSYFLVAIVVFIVVFTISRPVITEFSRLSNDLPQALELVVVNMSDALENVPFVVIDKTDLSSFFSNQVLDQLISSGSSGIDWTLVTISGFGSLLSSLFIGLALSIYFMFDHDHYLDFVLERITDEHKRALVKELVDEVERKLGNWLFTQGLLIVIIGVMTFIMLKIVRVDFALPLAVMAGLFSLIPTIGPVIAAIVITVFALVFNGFGTAVAVVVGSVIIQQIDNALITPRLMGNVSGLSPVFVLLGVMVGFSIGGIIGAIMAVPVLVILKIGMDFYMKFRKLNEADL